MKSHLWQQAMNIEDAADGAPAKEPCDHDWKWCDESFDHAFGTERVHFWRCEKCDAEKEPVSADYHDDCPDLP